MASWDDAFLSEVEDFLTSCEPSHVESASDIGDAATKRRKTSGGAKSRVHRNARAQSKMDDSSRHRAYRERQRTEREKLEEEVEKLQTQLIKVRARMISLSAWSVLSKRQLRARLAAEEHRRRLRSVVSMQSALIQGYGAFVREHTTSDDSLTQEHSVSSAFKTQWNQPDTFDSEFFKYYAKELDEVYAQTDAVFSSGDLAAATKEPSNSWREGRRSGSYLFTTRHSVPFNFTTTSEVLWRAAYMAHRHETRQFFHGVGDPEDTVALKFCVTSRQTSGGAAAIQHRAISRRYRERGRMVMVWRIFMEGEGAFSGMHADVVGWGVVVPSTDPSRKLTLLRSCMRYMPMHFTGTAACESRVSAFTRFVLKVRAYDACEIIQSLQKLLRTEAC